jgi:hypothetical protein
MSCYVGLHHAIPLINKQSIKKNLSSYAELCREEEPSDLQLILRHSIILGWSFQQFKLGQYPNVSMNDRTVVGWNCCTPHVVVHYFVYFYGTSRWSGHRYIYTHGIVSKL